MEWIVAGAVVVVLALAFVWMGLGLTRVLHKLGEEPFAAWVPVYRYIAAARAAELPTAPVWVARCVAAACWLLFGVIVLVRAADVAAGSADLAAVALLAFVVAVLGSFAGWAVWIVGANRIEARLVVHSRMVWLAALVPPAWATVVGFGSTGAVIAGPVTGQRDNDPQPELDDATRAIQRVTPPPPTPPEPDAAPTPTAASDLPNPAPEPDTTEPALVAAPLAEVAMTTDDHDITGQVQRLYSPYDRVASPAGPVAATPWDYEDDDDQTFYTKRRRARWVLRIVGGDEYDLEDVTTIGREGIRPIPGVLAIIDDTRTMSKLHARLRRGSDTWYVTDLGSTNGTFVRDTSGNEIEVEAQTEKKIEGTLLLGDLEAVIVDQRESA